MPLPRLEQLGFQVHQLFSERNMGLPVVGAAVEVAVQGLQHLVDVEITLGRRRWPRQSAWCQWRPKLTCGAPSALTSLVSKTCM